MIPRLTAQALGPAVATTLALSVFLLNGTPLVYFDSAAYLEQGARMIGPAPPAGATAPATGTTDPEPAPHPDKTVNGSRSAVYGLWIALADRMAGLSGVVAANMALIWLATWLLARTILSTILSGQTPARRSPATLAAAGILAACFGSLPFYVAFVMPDILAPILILMIAVLTVRAGRLPLWETGLCLALALFAVLSHPSHLLLAPPLALLGVFVSPLAAGRRRGIGLGLVAAIALLGITERLIFSAATEHFLHRRVVYLPFLTARLIDDGPGLAELRDRCPDPAYPTCVLYDALAAGSDPSRFDAPNIIFSRTAERGSFARLPEEDRLAVTDHQLIFVCDVLLHRPLAILAAIGRNTVVQLSYFSVGMTVPDRDTLASAHAIGPLLPASLDNGRLVDGSRDWLRALTIAHGFVYAASLAVLAWLWLRRRLAVADRALVLMVLGGIVLNALICGSVSEPAHRYGARVMFLLPMLAAMLGIARRTGRPDPQGTSPPS